MSLLPLKTYGEAERKRADAEYLRRWREQALEHRLRRLEEARAAALPEPKPVGRRSLRTTDDAVVRAVLAETKWLDPEHQPRLTAWGLTKAYAHRLPGRANERTKCLRFRAAMQRVAGS
jgi:hypothetical protein